MLTCSPTGGRGSTSRIAASSGSSFKATSVSFNQYDVIVVNPAKHAHGNKDLAQALADWVLSRDGQSTIASYKINGEQLFFPNANQ